MKITKSLIRRIQEINVMIDDVNKKDEMVEMDSSCTWAGSPAYLKPIQVNKHSVSIKYKEPYDKKWKTDLYHNDEDLRWQLTEIRKGCKKVLK